MENIKYTSDGKKVVIVGTLNSQEKIVQEIFITNGQEIPSGENFVVKSLHDYPVVSWKEKNLSDIERNYNEKREMYDKEISALNRNYQKLKDSITEKNKYLRKYIDNVAEESFDVLTMFLKGEVKYLVKTGWSPEIIEFKDQQDDDRELKLITLFGRDDGTLTWGINRYSDGSGDNTKYFVCSSYKDAKIKLEEEIKKYGRINEYIISEAKKHDIELDSQLLKEYIEKKIKEKQEIIDRKKQEIINWEKEINELKNI